MFLLGRKVLLFVNLFSIILLFNTGSLQAKVVINKRSGYEFSSLMQQNRTVKGKVVDEKGIPLPGVTILVVGSTKGVSTDLDGSYSIDVKTTDKLLFSFIGMESQTIEGR